MMRIYWNIPMFCSVGVIPYLFGDDSFT